MSQRSRALLAVALLPLALACSKGDPVGTGRAGPHFVDVPDEMRAKAVSEALIRCESPAECPAGIALLVVTSAKQLAQCSSFLVDEQHLMTNSHCVPPELRHEGADCSKSLTAVFPETSGLSSERVACSKVVKVSSISPEPSEYDGESADWALLKLEKAVQRRPFALSREGLEDGLKLRAYTLDPMSTSRIEGLLRVKDCEAVQYSVSIPSFTDRFSPVGAFKGCKIIQGNSGSPAVDSSGSVRAIVHGSSDERELELVFLDGRKEKRKMSFMGAMTNVACTTLPETSGGDTTPASCERRASVVDLVEKMAEEEGRDSDARLFRQFVKSSPGSQVFSFKLGHSVFEANGLEIPVRTPELECLKPQAARAGQEHAFSKPLWGFNSDVDEHYRLRVYSQIYSTSRVHVKIVEIVGAKARIEISERAPQNDANESKTAVLPICP